MTNSDSKNRRPPPDSESISENPVDALAEAFVQRLRRGEYPSISEYKNQYPELAGEIEELFPTLAMVEKCGADTNDEGPCQHESG